MYELSFVISFFSIPLYVSNDFFKNIKEGELKLNIFS